MYLEKFGGYIVDVPNAIFTRCDGKQFSYDSLESFSASPAMDPITINGGWSRYPRAIIPAGMTGDIQMTSSEFRLDMFELAYNTDITETSGYVVTESNLYDVQTGLKVVLPEGATNIYISGLEQAEAAAAGKFTVAPAQSPATGVEVTFNTGDVAIGDTIRVFYQITKNGQLVTARTDSPTAKGSLQLMWPIYSSGTDCSESAVKGTLYAIYFKVMVSQLPGFSNSYKSASTNGLSFSVLDPGRSDYKSFDYFIVENTAAATGP